MGLTTTQLKTIAIIAMVIDHVGVVFFPNIIIFRIIGRLTFPIMSYFIMKGFLHTSNLKKYFVRIILTLCFSIIPYYLVFDVWSGTVMFTFILSLILLYCYKKNMLLFFASLLPCLILSRFSDYSYFGLFLPLIFYIARLRNMSYLPYIYIIVTSSLAVYFLGYMHIYCVPVGIFMLLPLPFLENSTYNKRKNIKYKYLFYVFYPSHLFILFILQNILK
ncbi:TraX family protein [Culicoidibacter larvae]